MFGLVVLLSAFINFTQIFLQFIIVTKLFRIKMNWAVTLVFSATVSILYFDDLILMMGIFFVSTVVYYGMLVRMRWKYIVLAISIQLFMTMSISNMSIMVQRMFVQEINIHSSRIASTLVLIMILMLVKRGGISAINLTRKKIVYVLSLTLMLVALVSMVSEYLLLQVDVAKTTVILNSIGVLIIQLIMVYIVFVLNKFASEIDEAELQKQYAKSLEKTLVEQVGSYHGYVATIEGLYGYCETNNGEGLMDEVKRLYNKLHETKARKQIDSRIRDYFPYLYVMIENKLSISYEKGIRFSIAINAKTLIVKTVSNMQLLSMLGNLLNNAVEHAEFTSEKFVILEISNTKDERLCIAVINSVDERIDTSELCKRGVSGKLGHTGFGLFEVKTIVDNSKDEGLPVEFKVNCTDTMFTAELIV